MDRPSEKRTADCPRSRGIPIAVNTCDGSVAPEAQADPDDAAELTQETFVKIIENIDKFQGRSRFYTWAFRIAVNLTLNYCQRNAKLALSSLDSEKERSDGQAKQVLKDVYDKFSSTVHIIWEPLSKIDLIFADCSLIFFLLIFS